LEQKWSIRAYREGDEEGILELSKAVFPAKKLDREQWLRQWRWMYKDNPAGVGRIWLAEHNDKIVGQYAMIPIIINISDDVDTSAHSVDTMTHPDYRYQGIFETLAKKTYAEAAKEGIHIVYGFPNKNSHPGFIKKLSWFDISSLKTMIKLVNWEHIVERRIRNKLLSRLATPAISLVFSKLLFRTQQNPKLPGLTITQISSFDERINEFWPRVSSQYPIMVVRDKDYLNWRYVTVPDVDYTIYTAEKAGEIHGYTVFQCLQQEQGRTCVIFDILAQSEHIAQCLISKVIEQCKQEQVDSIFCNMIANKIYLRAFRRNGFMSIPFSKGSSFCAYSSAPHASKEFLKDPRNWLIQLGDSVYIPSE